MLWLLAMMAHAGTVTYVYTDAQGTPVMESDAQGHITKRFEYTPYGMPVTSVGAAPDGPGYTGHVNDPETGLVYMQARYYDPEVGRFLSVDPVGPQAGNIFNIGRFGYVSGNPIMLVDPSGRSPRHGKDMEICNEPVPCDSGGPSRVQLTPSPFSMPLTTAQLAEADKSPAGLVVIGGRGVLQSGCGNNCVYIWRYQLINAEGVEVYPDGTVREHVTRISFRGNKDYYDSNTNDSFQIFYNGVITDKVGVSGSNFPRNQYSDMVFRQTFTVRTGVGSLT
ncbi:hypothetical protein UU7_17072 [Rhodanobacter spathiphylli B39]|uniref:Teneurin-like YD-shell domain-containing protein n=1 Tax=Rhodanobacter spathiphylli B39 TaxID=1163407 RepID=I4VNB5_9GAMM|nr:hypothetical protein UU7_17072 [Rhodanobacter spathiphylli B39]